MSELIRWYPGDRALEFLLVVTLGVALASSAAWLVSRRLAGNAAMRHLVLFSGLACCLALPAAAWVFGAIDVTLVSIPLLGEEQGIRSRQGLDGQQGRGEDKGQGEEQGFREDLGNVAAGRTQVDSDPVEMPPRPSTDTPPDAAEPPLPQTNATTGEIANGAATGAADRSQATHAPSAPDVQAAAGPAAGESATTRVSFRGIATGAMLVWASGVLLTLVRLARNCVRVVQLRRRSSPVLNERLQTLLREGVRQVGARRFPLLLVSSRAVAPLAVGFGRPAVILPERLLKSVNDDELRDVLVHEMAHLERGDQRIVLLQALAGALYWPILPIHGLNRQLQRAREELCDNVVLASRDAISYGETLLHVAELLVRVRPMDAAVGILGGEGELERRIAGLIDPRRNTMTKITRKRAYIVMSMFIATTAIAAATRLAALAGAAEPTKESVAADAATEPQASSTQADAAAQPPTRNADPQAAANADGLKRAGHFSGVVTGLDGKPVKDARVYLVPNSGFRSAGLSGGGNVLLNPIKSIGPIRGRTDAEGRFEFDAPDMTYTTLDGHPVRRQGFLVATAEGFAPDWIEKTWGNDSRSGSHWDPVKAAKLHLQLLEIGEPIQGRFLGPDGKPLAGARVRITKLMIPEDRDLLAHLLRQTSGNGLFLSVDYEKDLDQPALIPGITTETETRADGRFTLSGLGRDWLAILEVSEPSIETTTMTVMTRDAPAIDVSRDINGKPLGVIHGAKLFGVQQKPGRTIKGRVVDRESGEPIPDMWVGPRQDYRIVSPHLYPWVTDDKGRFTITGLPPKLAAEILVAIAPPGVPYQTAGNYIGGEEVMIKVRRGIPFRLNVVDEQGRPVDAEVTYVDVQPNPHVENYVPWGWDIKPLYLPYTPAARRAEGTYEGFVMPGPGAVLVHTSRHDGYRPAHVDPKSFFTPGRKQWSETQKWAYGDDDTLATTPEGQRIDQTGYEAIVLVNPPPGSDPLELTATLVKDRPRQVNFIDAQGNPVFNITWTAYGSRHHAHALPLTGLHPQRVRPLVYWQEDRKLIGFLLARGDGDSPYTVRMEPWAAVTGRVVDQHGKPLAGTTIAITGDHPVDAERHLGAKTDSDGGFQISQLIPGHRYTGKVHRGNHNIGGRLIPLFAGIAFENLELKPGEVRDLGDIRTKPPIYEEFPLDYKEYDGAKTKPRD